MANSASRCATKCCAGRIRRAMLLAAQLGYDGLELRRSPLATHPTVYRPHILQSCAAAVLMPDRHLRLHWLLVKPKACR